MSQSSILTCGACHTNKAAHELMRCSRCKFVLYCSKECQTLDWSKHKLQCSPHTQADIEYIDRCIDFVLDRLKGFLSRLRTCLPSDNHSMHLHVFVYKYGEAYISVSEERHPDGILHLTHGRDDLAPVKIDVYCEDGTAFHYVANLTRYADAHPEATQKSIEFFHSMLKSCDLNVMDFYERKFLWVVKDNGNGELDYLIEKIPTELHEIVANAI